MEFVRGQARLQWKRGQGYLHPQNGIWVAEPARALKGWIVEDPAARRDWVELIAAIGQFWRHNRPEEVDPEAVVEFA